MAPTRTRDRPAVSIGDTATPGGRCPACGEPLFPWLEVQGQTVGTHVVSTRVVGTHVLDRCENCGLVLAREDDGEGLAALIEDLARDAERNGAATVELPNAAGLQSGIGAESWSGLRPPAEPAVLTPRALELLLEHEGLELTELSYSARAGMAAMMGTIFNLLSFNRDFAGSVFRGELRPGSSRAGLIGFAIDSVVTAFTAIPVAILSVLLEGGAILAHRGGVIRATARVARS